MAGGSIFQRVFQYVAQELIVDNLANNPSFQRFAVRSSKALEELAQKGVQVRKQLSEQMQDIAEGVKDEVSRGTKR